MATTPPTVPGATTTTPPTTTTTLPPEIVSDGEATTEAAPTAQVVSPGQASATVNGEKIAITITRENNQLVFSGAGITGTLRGTKANGDPIALDTDGNLRIETGDRVSLESEGFGADSLVDVWLFSTPQKIGTITADAAGKSSGTFTVDSNLEAGNHRLVLKGVNNGGDEVVLAIGIVAGAIDVTSTLSRVLIAIPIALAVFVGLFIPNQVRRRRRKRLNLA